MLLDATKTFQKVKFNELKYEIHKWNELVRESSKLNKQIVNGSVRNTIYRTLNAILIEVNNTTHSS